MYVYLYVEQKFLFLEPEGRTRNNMAVEPMRLFSIREALGSNLDRDAEYPVRLFDYFPQSLPGMCRDSRYSKIGHGRIVSHPL